MDILRLALLSLAAVIAVVLGISFLFQAEQPVRTGNAGDALQPTVINRPQTETLTPARQRIEAQIARAAPAYARFFDRLKAVLPIEYNAIFDKFARQSLDGTDMTNVDALVAEAVRDVRISNGVLAAEADGTALSHIFDTQLEMMQALAAKDQKLCVDFLYGGASQAFFTFSANNRLLVADMAIAGVNAIGSGRANKIERQPPSDADFAQLESTLKTQGLNQVEIAAILDGKSPKPPISDARMCAVGQIYLKTLASLPEQARFRIYALAVQLMARS